MDDAETGAIRNVALVGHIGNGKTTLGEAMLHHAGVTNRLGKVDDGSSLLDSEPEAVARRISVTTSLAPISWTARGATFKVNVIDTPGHDEFGAATEAGLAVADLAVVVISATDGVQPGDERVWERCAELGLPRIVVVTKEDKPNVDFERVLADVQARLDPACLAVEIPVAEQERFVGVADLLSEQVHTPGADGHDATGPVPNELAADEHRRHEELVESVVSEDDEQLERYLAGDEPGPDELMTALAHEVGDGIVFPTLVVSGLTGVGVEHLLDLICLLGPAPRPTTLLVGGEPTAVAPDPDGPLLVHVFRTAADPFVGQLSLFKVLSGTLHGEEHLVNRSTGVDERLRGTFFPSGKDHVPAPTVVAGDLAAVAKLSASPSSSLLAPAGLDVALRQPAVEHGGFTRAIRPLTQSDDDKLGEALRRLSGEDPSLRVTHDDELGQTLVTAVGETHLAVSLERLERKFGVHVDAVDPAIPYRETIRGSAEVEGKVKKQSGGHGQFAVVRMVVRPGERGSGLTFVNSVVGGAIPRNYMTAVEKGVEDAMAHGGPAGFPLTDLVVEVVDGKAHSVDSSDMAFRTAAAQGVAEALRQAGADVLEPVASVHVALPVSAQGDVLSDLAARRGRVVDTAGDGEGTGTIDAYVPMAELLRFAIDLRALTGGRGRYSAELDHYDVVAEQHVVVPAGEPG